MVKPSKSSANPTDLTSQMNDFEDQLPQSLYDLADEVRLADLLALPATRHWAISMISNIANTCLDDPSKYSQAERLMIFNVMSVNSQLPQDIRLAAFSQCSQAQQRRREARQHQDE